MACSAPAHPQRPELGQRDFGLGAQLWIDREDFAELPAKGKDEVAQLGQAFNRMRRSLEKAISLIDKG